MHCATCAGAVAQQPHNCHPRAEVDGLAGPDADPRPNPILPPLPECPGPLLSAGALFVGPGRVAQRGRRVRSGSAECGPGPNAREQLQDRCTGMYIHHHVCMNRHVCRLMEWSGLAVAPGNIQTRARGEKINIGTDSASRRDRGRSFFWEGRPGGSPTSSSSSCVARSGARCSPLFFRCARAAPIVIGMIRRRR